MKPNAITDRLTNTDRGVSPVIGVILMVAITVILAAVIGTFVLDLGQSAGNSAPSASLTVDVTASPASSFNVSHKGGDALQSDSTRVLISEVDGGDQVTFEPAGSDAFSVGDSVGFNSSSGGNTWQLEYDAGSSTEFDVSAGNQYEIQFIDTDSQRVIFETTITA